MPILSRIRRRLNLVQPSARAALGLVLLLWARLATAQSTLGELLDAGATRLSPEEFKQELVQRMIVGPTSSGGSLEVMYAGDGTVQGIGTYAKRAPSTFSSVFGQWKIGDNGKICTNMQFASGFVGTFGVFPDRCQFWFKHDGQYFLADSDWDRSATVLKRTVKQ